MPTQSSLVHTHTHTHTKPAIKQSTRGVYWPPGGVNGDVLIVGTPSTSETINSYGVVVFPQPHPSLSVVGHKG